MDADEKKQGKAAVDLVGSQVRPAAAAAASTVVWLAAEPLIVERHCACTMYFCGCLS
jgi:hypothetical protein